MRARILALVLVAALLALVGCKTGKPEQSETILYQGVWGTPLRAEVDSGVLYNDPEQGVSFFDYETFQSVSICSKPNCAHDPSDESCGARGLGFQLAYYNDKLYYVQSDSYYDKNNDTISEVNIYACDRDGGNRQKLNTLTGVTSGMTNLYMLSGDKLYYIFDEPEFIFNEQTGAADYLGRKASDLYTYDIGDNTFTKLATLISGYEVSVSAIGYEDNVLYYAGTRSTERLMGTALSPEEQKGKKEYGFYKLDIHTGVVSDWAHNPPADSILALENGYVYYQDDYLSGGTYYIKRMNMQTGEGETLVDIPIYSANIVDNKIFMRAASNYTTGEKLDYKKHKDPNANQYYYDIESGTLNALEASLPGASMRVVTTYQDTYILRVVVMSDTDEDDTVYMAKIKKSDYLNGSTDFIATCDIFI